MATALKKNLRELIECGICLDPMVDPRVLSCQHSFCAKCLIDLSSHSGAPKKIMICPTCRCQTAMPREGIYNLPSDFKTNALAALVNESEKREDSPTTKIADQVALDVDIDSGAEFFDCTEVPKCAVCPEDKQVNKVKMFCKYCKDFMCSACAADHKNTSIFSTHELVYIPNSNWKNKKCRQHPQKPQEYFCEDCKVLVCSACANNAHRNHDVYYYVEHFKNRQEEIKRKRGALETVYSDSFISSANQIEMENYSSTVNQTMTKIKEDVEKSAKRAIKEVEREKAGLLSFLEQDRLDFNKRFKDAQPYQLKSDVHILLQECEAYLKTRKPVELLTDFQHLSLNIDSTTKSIEKNRKEVSSFLSSYIPKQFNYTSQIMVIGDIIFETVGTSISFPDAQLAKQFLKPLGAETSPELGLNSGDHLFFPTPQPQPPPPQPPPQQATLMQPTSTQPHPRSQHPRNQRRLIYMSSQTSKNRDRAEGEGVGGVT